MKKALIWIVVIIVAIVAYIVYSRAEAPTQESVATTTPSMTTTETARTQTTGATGGAAQAPLMAPGATLPASQVIQAKTVAVSISDFSFTPKVITITPGTRVTWTNRDSMAHTVTSFPGGPNSGELARGASYSFTFNTVGTFNYHCAIHPGMTGTVFVVAQ